MMDLATKKRIKNQIRDMVREDRNEHKAASKSGSWERWEKLTQANGEKLKVLIDKFGWFTVSAMGEKTSRDAWFIVQHSDADPVFQRNVLLRMKMAAKKNPKDIIKKNLAFLEDRVLVNSGRKQLYGSQFYTNRRGEMIPRPIRDLKHLEERRKEYGLPPFREYLESAKEYSAKKKNRNKVK